MKCERCGKNTDMFTKCLSYGLGSVDKDSLWPEAWKMSIKIADLTPNNFNTYVDHFTRGFTQIERNNMIKLAGQTTINSSAQLAKWMMKFLGVADEQQAKAESEKLYGQLRANTYDNNLIVLTNATDNDSNKMSLESRANAEILR